MERTEIKTVLATGKAGEDVAVAGWIKSVRASKSVGFIHLNDGSTFDNLQVVVPEAFTGREQALKQITGAALLVKGKLVASPAKGQALDLDPASIEVLGECDPASPVQKAGASYPVIGAHLGGRDHSTVIHACQSIERRRKEDSRMRLTLETVAKRFETP